MSRQRGAPGFRIGIDLGGTKIAGVVLADDGRILEEKRIPAPRQDYAASVQAVAGLVGALQGTRAEVCTIGIGMLTTERPRMSLSSFGVVGRVVPPQVTASARRVSTMKITTFGRLESCGASATVGFVDSLGPGAAQATSKQPKSARSNRVPAWATMSG